MVTERNLQVISENLKVLEMCTNGYYAQKRNCVIPGNLTAETEVFKTKHVSHDFSRISFLSNFPRKRCVMLCIVSEGFHLRELQPVRCWIPRLACYFLRFLPNMRTHAIYN